MCGSLCVQVCERHVCVTKLRVKELCAEVCVKELHVCVCMKALCAEVCVCVRPALHQRVLTVFSSKRRGSSLSSLVDGQRRGQ